MTPWPWWLGALALGGVAVGFAVVVGRALGVSGSLARVLRGPDGELPADDDAVAAALLEATQAEFGAAAIDASTSAPDDDVAPPMISRAPRPLAYVGHLSFLLAMVAGGAIAALTHGGWHARLELGPDFARFVGSGGRAWLALGLGGALVGFGTAMAGGCTSGHGLCGNARLQRGSMVATAAFFGAGVAVSFLLAWLA